MVHFIPKETSYENGICLYAGKEHAAQIAFVHSDRLINVSILDANGKQFNRTSVPLVQDGDPPYDGDHCRWMPYQIGQAKPAA